MQRYDGTPPTTEDLFYDLITNVPVMRQAAEIDQDAYNKMDDETDFPQIDGLAPGVRDDPCGVAMAVLYQALRQAPAVVEDFDKWAFLQYAYDFFKPNAEEIDLSKRTHSEKTFTYQGRKITVYQNDHKEMEHRAIDEGNMTNGLIALKSSTLLEPDPQREEKLLRRQFRKNVAQATFSNLFNLVLMIDKFVESNRLDQDPVKMNRHTCLRIAHEVFLQRRNKTTISEGFNTEGAYAKPVTRLTYGDRQAVYVVDNSTMYVELLPTQPPPKARVAPADGMTDARLCASCQWRPTIHSSYW